MATPREQAVAELRRSIDVLPERTRKAMLIGLKNNTVITGAFSASGDGVCPMLAAHRAGGRTACASFPEAWDKFTGVYGRPLIRPATEYEVQILCREIEASLEPVENELAAAIADHQATVQARIRDEAIAAEQAAAPPRKRRLRITGGESLDLTEAITEHKETARSRRSREAEQVGLDWLFEEVLVLPEDFDGEPDADEEFDFDAAEAELTR